MAASNPSPLAKYKLVGLFGASSWPAAAAHRSPDALPHLMGATHLLQVFLGDQAVGKTSIITRFMYDKFDNTYQVNTSTSSLASCHHNPWASSKCIKARLNRCLLNIANSYPTRGA